MNNKSNSKVILICEECFSRNYAKSKSIIFKKERLELKKFCKTCGSHQIHKESK